MKLNVIQFPKKIFTHHNNRRDLFIKVVLNLSEFKRGLVWRIVILSHTKVISETFRRNERQIWRVSVRLPLWSCFCNSTNCVASVPAPSPASLIPLCYSLALLLPLQFHSDDVKLWSSYIIILNANKLTTRNRNANYPESVVFIATDTQF